MHKTAVYRDRWKKPKIMGVQTVVDLSNVIQIAYVSASCKVDCWGENLKIVGFYPPDIRDLPGTSERAALRSGKS